MKTISAMHQLYQFARLGAALNPRLWHPIKGAPRLARLHPDADAAHTARGFHELAKSHPGVLRFSMLPQSDAISLP